MKSIGELIKSRRKEHCLTKAYLAHRAGTTASYTRKIENDKETDPHLRVMAEIYVCLDLYLEIREHS